MSVSTVVSSSSSSRRGVPFDLSTVHGNAPDAVKAKLGNIVEYLDNFLPPSMKDTAFFGREITDRFEVVEVSVVGKADEPRKREGRVVVEMDVKEDMLNGGGNIHGGCSAFLVDMCSSLAMSALNLTEAVEAGGECKEIPNVSQAINMIYHSPAGLGDRLRIVNTSLTLGNRARSGRTEIWNATHHRLVASGTHIKMAPSPAPTPKSKL